MNALTRWVVAGGVLGSAMGLSATILTPSVLGSADPFSGSFVAGNLIDSNRNSEFATSSNGAGTLYSTDVNDGTWVTFDFGSPVAVDRFFAITRFNSADVVGEARLTFSNDTLFDGSDTSVIIGSSGSDGAGPVVSFPTVTARYARWDVVTSLGASPNLGAQEMRFLVAPPNSQYRTATVIDSWAPFSGSYAAANALNNDVGRDRSGREYATNGGGTNTFLDFDFGLPVSLAGFDLFQRQSGGGDEFTAFDLIFADEATFAAPLATLPFTISGFHSSEQGLNTVEARFVRLQVTVSGGGNNGVAEIMFYESLIPEPGTLGLIGLGVFVLSLRRRR